MTHGVTIANTSVTVNGTFFQATQPISISSITIGNFPATQPVSIASVTIGSLPLIAGTVTAMAGTNFRTAIEEGILDYLTNGNFPVDISSSLPAGTAQIGSVTASISNFPATQTTTFGAITGSVSVLNFPASQAVTFSAVSISNFPASQSTTFGAVTGSISVLNFPATQAISISSVTIGNSITISSVPPISGSVTLGAGDQQIGSVTASISGTIPISISSVTIGNFPATQTIAGSVTASGTVTANAGDTSFFVSGLDVYAHRSVLYSSSGNGFINDAGAPVDIENPLPIVGRALQGTSVTTSNFTSTTASTVLANYNATRQVLTIFNEGAGNLHICAGATCTTIAYQVRLSAGDYFEVPNHQTTITHSAVFATAGTARVTEVS